MLRHDDDIGIGVVVWTYWFMGILGPFVKCEEIVFEYFEVNYFSL